MTDREAWMHRRMARWQCVGQLRRDVGMRGETEETVGKTEAKARRGATVKSMLSRGDGVFNGREDGRINGQGGGESKGTA